MFTYHIIRIDPLHWVLITIYCQVIRSTKLSSELIARSNRETVRVFTVVGHYVEIKQFLRPEWEQPGMKYSRGRCANTGSVSIIMITRPPIGRAGTFFHTDALIPATGMCTSLCQDRTRQKFRNNFRHRTVPWGTPYCVKIGWNFCIKCRPDTTTIRKHSSSAHFCLCVNIIKYYRVR